MGAAPDAGGLVPLALAWLAGAVAGRDTTGHMMMLGAVFLFACQDLSAKYLALFFPVPFIAWARFASNLALNLTQSVAGGGFRADWRANRLGLQLLRSFLLAFTALLYYHAISMLEIATAMSIFFIYPLVIAVLAPPLIGERLSRRRWLYIAVGFAGALVVIRPGMPSFHPAMLLVLCCTVSFSLFSIVTRVLSKSDNLRTTNLYTCVVGTVVFLPGLLLLGGSWEPPGHWWPWVLVLSMGAMFAGVGHVLLLRAHKLVPAPDLAPMFYTQIGWVVVGGYLVFGHIPDLPTFVGIAAIVLSSLAMLRMEMKTSRELAGAQASSSVD